MVHCVMCVVGWRKSDQRGARARALVCATDSNDLFRCYGTMKHKARNNNRTIGRKLNICNSSSWSMCKIDAITKNI